MGFHEEDSNCRREEGKQRQVPQDPVRDQKRRASEYDRLREKDRPKAETGKHDPKILVYQYTDAGDADYKKQVVAGQRCSQLPVQQQADSAAGAAAGAIEAGKLVKRAVQQVKAEICVETGEKHDRRSAETDQQALPQWPWAHMRIRRVSHT